MLCVGSTCCRVRALLRTLWVSRAASRMSGKSRDSPGAAEDYSVPVSLPVPWGHIAGKAWGDPSGRRVLALHGWLDNAGSFDKLIPLLSDDLYVVAIDLPGHGLSSHRPKGVRCHYVDYIADVKYAADALKWDKFMMLTHSMGCGIASLFAAALPNHVQALVFIEGFGVASRPLAELPQLMGRALSNISAQVTHVDKVYPSWEAVVSRVHEGHLFDPHLDKESAEILARRGTKQVEGGYKFTRDHRLKEPSLLYTPHEVNKAFLQRISCPTLLILAENSALQPAELQRRSECVPKDKLSVVTVPGGHHVHLYHPQSVAAHINMFLTSRGHSSVEER